MYVCNNEAAQNKSEAIKLAIATASAALLHLRLSLTSVTVSSLFVSVSSVMKDTHGAFSKILSPVVGLNSALKVAANFGD